MYIHRHAECIPAQEPPDLESRRGMRSARPLFLKLTVKFGNYRCNEVRERTRRCAAGRERAAASCYVCMYV